MLNEAGLPVVEAMLPPDGVYTCKAIQFIEALSVYVVDLNDVKGVLLNKVDPLLYLEKRVQVTFRAEKMQGTYCVVINQLTVLQVALTFESREYPRLYTDSELNSGASIRFRDIENNTTAVNSCVFCKEQSVKASAKAVWLELVCLDMEFRTANVRLFTPNTKEAQFAGSFVICDLRRNDYGLSTDEVTVCNNIEAPIDPDTAVCRDFLLRVLAEVPGYTIVQNMKMGAMEWRAFASAVHFAGDAENVYRDIDQQLLLSRIIGAFAHHGLEPDKTATNSSRRYLALLKASIRDKRVLGDGCYVTKEAVLADRLVAMTTELVKSEYTYDPDGLIKRRDDPIWS